MTLQVVLERQEEFSLGIETRDVLARGLLIAEAGFLVGFVRAEGAQGDADLKARVSGHVGVGKFPGRRVTLDIVRGDHERRDIVSVHRFQLFPVVAP